MNLCQSWSDRVFKFRNISFRGQNKPSNLRAVELRAGHIRLAVATHSAPLMFAKCRHFTWLPTQV
jgi:hypothetical protein